MNATIYGCGQSSRPGPEKKSHIDTGDVVSVEPEGDGRLVLVRLEKPKRNRHHIRLVKRKGRHAVLTGGPVVTAEQVGSSGGTMPSWQAGGLKAFLQTNPFLRIKPSPGKSG